MNVPKTYVLFFFALFVINTGFSQDLRSIDGSGNNIHNPEYGATHQPVLIQTSLQYSDGIDSPAGVNRANARTISNELFASVNPKSDVHNLSNMVWAFGKFLEHEISYFETTSNDPLYVKVPRCDQFFDRNCSGDGNLTVHRISALPGTGVGTQVPRNVANQSTSWIDGSSIYGTTSEDAAWLRTNNEGKLKTSDGNFLPFNTSNGKLNGITDSNAPKMDLKDPARYRYFVTGDPRANQNLVLLSIYTLFVREHNRTCDEILLENPGLTDEQVYQRARRKVAGIIQNITYNHWLPTIGVTLEPYRGYNSSVNPNISNEFCAAGFKIWNTLQNDYVSLLDDQCKNSRFGNLDFNDLHYNSMLMLQIDLDPLLKGLSSKPQMNMDYEVVDAIRNFEFNSSNINIKTDWIAMDIMRARERGLPDYNSMRSQLGLAPVERFSEITSNESVQRKLIKLYKDVNNIDPWVGLIAEDHFPKSMIGETLNILIRDQFSRLRNGDRFYFENDPALSEQEKSEIRNTTLADIVTRNTDLSFIQDNIFKSDPKCLELEVEEKHLSGIVFPNPVVNEMDISVFSRIEGAAEMKIMDTYGKTIETQRVELAPGRNILHCRINKQLSAGMYFIRIQQNNKTGLIKFIKSS
ncbi:peroxidase family protein [Membranihabitans maritimus]|uniref:peroxidase family protein n=1 Tax=Membranihabitans maritimus TaxID=2904244 RepID=UPI001F18261F|nr:peroxidase family protein [Membranihabitans maritimus]